MNKFQSSIFDRPAEFLLALATGRQFFLIPCTHTIAILLYKCVVAYKNKIPWATTPTKYIEYKIGNTMHSHVQPFDPYYISAL
jgi:hypothetical protein